MARRLWYGFSTGALARGRISAGVAMCREAHGGAIEISALRGHELRRVCAVLGEDPLSDFGWVSVHAPAHDIELSDEECARALGWCAKPVVVHADKVGDWAPWRKLGRLLLVENPDHRSQKAKTPDEIDTVFSQVPQARMCLDVSHAIGIGGTEMVLEMAERFANRIVEIHVGCGSGEQRGSFLRSDELEALSSVGSVLRRRSVEGDLAVIAELATEPAEDLARRQALRAMQVVLGQSTVAA